MQRLRDAIRGYVERGEPLGELQTLLHEACGHADAMDERTFVEYFAALFAVGSYIKGVWTQHEMGWHLRQLLDTQPTGQEVENSGHIVQNLARSNENRRRELV